MNQQKFKNPKAKSVENIPVFDPNSNPYITNLNYDLCILKITLRFPALGYPIYLIFDTVCGFRLLDEQNLIPLWNIENAPEIWLWKIEQGGWLDLEKARDCFLSGMTDKYTEYFISGIDDCVSVISQLSPKLYISER